MFVCLFVCFTCVTGDSRVWSRGPCPPTQGGAQPAITTHVVWCSDAPPCAATANSYTGGFCRPRMCTADKENFFLASHSLLKARMTGRAFRSSPRVTRETHAGTPRGCRGLHSKPLGCLQPGVAITGSYLGVLPRIAPQPPLSNQGQVSERLPRTLPLVSSSPPGS